MKKDTKENTMNPKNVMIIAVALAGIALAPASQARQLSEDRGNGNSAAENVDALNLSTTGSDNTAHGWSSLFSNTSGSSNTVDGSQALYNNTIASGNTGIGFQALYSNISGDNNTAIGNQSLHNNTGGQANVANGNQALFNNATGSQNTADGAYALYYNTTGAFNTAIGTLALANNTTGRHNTALGEDAGLNLTTGDGNVCIGYDVRGVAGEFNTTRIKNIYSSLASGRPVYVDSDNKLGTLLSTRRVKNDIKPMDKASEAILVLNPVTFRYKKEIDPHGATQFGLVAEEVAEVNHDLVILDTKGKPESVRYEAINAMLLNEFIKEHKKVEKLEAALDAVSVRLQEQANQIQKVTAQMDATKPLPHLVLNNP